MASTAISAQGSTLQIGNGSGAAKTVSAAAAGYPTIVTATAHGFANGDIVTIAGASGAATLNATFNIFDVTTNTFAVKLDTTGDTITFTSGTATPVAWTAVNNWKTYNGFDGQASELDTTNLSSTAKEFKLGIVDYGNLQLEFDQDNSDTGQAAMLTAYGSSLGKQFKITLPNSNTATFTAYVRKFTSMGGVDQVVKRQADLRISGAVTWA
jgi:hypothetical protein